MAIVWETPPNPPSGLRGRQRSELRDEADKYLVELRANPERWARLWDLPTKEEANKRSAFIQKKGYSFAVRQTDMGYSVFGRFRGEDDEPPEETRASTFGQ